MLKLVFLVVLAIAFATAQINDPRCQVPSEFVILFPHPSDCTKFYKCVGTSAVEMYCPWTNTQETERLHFSPTLLTCDWPWHAGCSV